MHITPLVHALDSTVAGLEVTFRNLVMLPLVPREPGTASPRLDYLTLDEGLASGAVQVTELSEVGSVPELRVINGGPKPVLIIDGEELVGAKQNRVVNLSILVPAGASLTVPVSCVEAGRWRARSHGFATAAWTQYASGRAKRMAHVTDSMERRGERMSNQTDVWNDIAAMAARLESPSPTGAMRAIYDRHATSIDEFVTHCQPVDGQLGALFIVAGRIVGFDLFDAESTLRKLLPKLVRSAAVEALDAEPRDAGKAGTTFPLRQLADHFILRLRESVSHVRPALGLGQDVRLSANGLTGAALVAEERTVHVAAFALA